ncbi:MAG: phospholipase D-like domain-containing protein, partial [Candidatus Micrarchaeia archaeon]
MLDRVVRGNIDRIETISSYLNAMNYLIYLTLSELCNENDVVVSELERMKTVRLPSSLTVQDLKLWIENIDKVLSLALDDRSYQDGSIVNMFEEVSDTSDPSLLKMKLESVLQVVMRSIANEAKLRGQSERNLLSETLQRLSEHSSTLAVAQFTFKREQPQQKPVVKTVSGNILKIIGSIVKSISNLFVLRFKGRWLFLVISKHRILLKVFVFIASHGWGPFKIKRGLIKEFREAAKLNITPSPLNDFTIGICSLTRNGEYVFAIVEDVMERLPLVVQRFAKNLMIAEFQISQIRNKLIWKLLTLPLYIPIFYGVVTSVIALVVTVGELVGDLIKSRVNITFNMWIKRIAIASLLILTMIGSYVLAGLRLSSLANNTISPTPLPTPTPIVISTEESPTFESPLLTPDIVKEEGSDKPLQKDDLAHQFNLTPVFQQGNTVLYGLENGRLGYYSNVNGIGIFFTSPSDTVISKEVLVETVLISDIKNARERIDIAIYGLNRESIVSALEFALKNGIEVRIVCDADSTGEYWREYGRYFDRLMKAGAQVVSVNSAGIMHNKLIIIDDEIVWTGSMNLTDNCMTKNANVFYRIVSKEMAGILSHEFEQLFSQRSGYGKLDVTPERPINVNGVEIKILISPYDDFIRAMSHEIITTKGKIHFAIFALSEPQVTEAIRVSSAEEKIGLIDGTLKEQDWYTDEELSTEVEILPEGWLGKIHLKLMILDGKTVITGSANWTRSAQVRNDEIMFIIENEDFAKVHELYFKILYRELTGKELSQSEISKQFVRAKGNIGLFSLGVIGDGGLFILRKRKPRRIYRRKMRKSIVTSLRSACNPMWPAQVVSRQVLPELHQYLKRTSPELEGGTVFYVTPYLVSYLLSNEMDGFSTINELGMNTVGIGLLWKGMWVKKGVQVEFQRIDYSRLNLKKVGTILVPMYGKEEEVSVYAVSFNGSLLIFLELPEVTAIMEPSNIQMLEKQMLLLGRGSLCLIKELADGNPSLMEGLASLRIPVKQFRPVVVQGDGIIASTFLNPRTVRDSLQSGVLNKLVYVSTIRSDEEDLEISLDRLSEIGVAPQILNDYGIVGDGKIKCSDICMLYNQQVANTGRSKREHITSTLKFRNLICGGIRLSRWQHRDFKELLRKDYNRDNVRAMMSIHKTAKRNFIDWIQHKTGNILNSDNLFLVVDPMASQINFSDA